MIARPLYERTRVLCLYSPSSIIIFTNTLQKCAESSLKTPELYMIQIDEIPNMYTCPRLCNIMFIQSPDTLPLLIAGYKFIKYIL